MNRFQKIREQLDAYELDAVLLTEEANRFYASGFHSGGTDGAAIQHSRCGVPAGTLSIPCRYVHSACEVIDMRDMESALEIMKAFVNTEL